MTLDKKWTVLLIFATLSVCSAEVKMIFAIMRHSDRNPMNSTYIEMYYPNDPYKNVDWQPDGAMQLTNTGKRNAYRLGKFFRKRYDDLLGAKYNNNRVHFHAAQMARTINTAQLLAAGLFSPDESQIWNSKLRWTPVPVRVTPSAEDTTFFALGICENYRIDKQKSAKKIDQLLMALPDVVEFFQYLTLQTGVNYTTTTQGWILYHQFAAEAGRGLQLEQWVQKIYPDGKLRDISGIEYILQTYTVRMKRLLGGVWIKKFLNATDDIVANKITPKAFFYAGNEIQVAAVLNTLGVYEVHVPDYSSTVIFELHETNSRYYVKVIYKNQLTPVDLVIPGCENILCSLSIFRDIVKGITLENIEEDCGNRVEFSII